MLIITFTMANFYTQLESMYESLDLEDWDDDLFTGELDLDSQTVYKCQVCGKTLKTELGFQRHISRHENSGKSTASVEIDPETWKKGVLSALSKLVEEDLHSGDILDEIKSAIVSIENINVEAFIPLFQEANVKISDLEIFSTVL